MSETRDVAFVGLGVMGYPMAGHLAAAGHRVRVYNRTASRAAAWLEDHEGAAVDTPREAAEGNDIVFMCVGNDDDVRSVALGEDGVFAGTAPGAIVVDSEGYTRFTPSEDGSRRFLTVTPEQRTTVSATLVQLASEPPGK